jgi:3,4-dihydroxy 2-butanone 4-phosphate synthase/GTP cyclohydrolase II
MIKLDTIERAISDIAQGKMVIVVDDEKRENEGDLILAAQHATPEQLNIMLKMSSGLICVPITKETADKFNLYSMVQQNTAHFGVNFSVSIDAASKITTGASVADKVVTIKLLMDPSATAQSFVQPGHIFPLIAKEGGVLIRAGHTEAAIDLATLAGCHETAVISEVVNEDGSMARLPQLREIADKLGIALVSIKDLIAYRLTNEQLLYKTTTVQLPTSYGDFTLHLFENDINLPISVVLTKGHLARDKSILTRIHSECFTSDVLHSIRCDCGQQLDKAMRNLQAHDAGILIYLKQEGRGIGLINKIRAYKKQDDGLDTVDANFHLGFPADLRDYALAAQVLQHFGISSVKLMTNNPTKIENLALYGISVSERIPLEVSVNASNQKYLATKKTKMGHIFSMEI